MRAVALGATRGIGRALARGLAERGAQLFLLGRDADELARSARDLELRGARPPVGRAPCDLLDRTSFAPALERAEAALGGLDAVIVTAARFAPQAALEDDLEAVEQLLRADFTHTALFCELAARRLAAGGGGRLCVFGSVAGDRARRSVAIYGAAKTGLAHHLEGLDLRYRERGVRVLCVKPGFVRTDMTEGLPAPPFAAEPERVARATLRALDGRRTAIYAPGIWRLVMQAVRRLPRRMRARL